jgi:hypothetical protein
MKNDDSALAIQLYREVLKHSREKDAAMVNGIAFAKVW